MPKPLVSIITPTYNHEKFIGQCIKSVLAQSFSNWEQIIIDDGSADNTSKCVREYSDSRIHYYRIKHKGLSNLAEIYNQALNLAEGDFISILEGDDFWPPDKLSLQIQTFAIPEIILVWGKGVITNEYSTPIYTLSTIRTSARFKDFSCSTILKMIKKGNYLFPTCTVMIRKESIMKIGGFQPSPSGSYVDLPTWLKISLTYKEKGIFRFYNKNLGYWRTHSHQVSLKYRAQQLFDYANLLLQYNLKYNLKGYDTYSRYFQAKYALSAGKYKESYRLFIKLIIDPTLERKERLICILGIVSSLLRFDFIKLTITIKNRLNALRTIIPRYFF